MIKEWYTKVSANVARVMVGAGEPTRLLLAALAAGGHVLLDDVPGTGKTMLARSVALSLGLTFKRVQFTPDLLPSDLTGLNVWREGRFVFMPGPVFTHVLLADEINRATPKTQSALLEAMAEGQVTVDGESRPLEAPFFVVATQNPVEMEGTFPLPEAQLDRFLVRLSLGYPDPEAERALLTRVRSRHPIETVEAVSGPEEVRRVQRAVREVRVGDDVAAYVVALVRATREAEGVRLGASPRAAIGLERVAMALAAFDGRDFVVPDDMKEAARVVLPHRLILEPEARLEGLGPEAVVAAVLERVPVPAEPSR